MINNKGIVRLHMLRPFTFPERRKAKAFINELMNKEQKPFGSIDYIFCSDEYLLSINKEYLEHDDLTDIITFDLSENNDQLKGEVYISIDRVKENARIFKTSFHEELHRVMFHGALHLSGYKDKTLPEKQEMRAKEDYYLKLFK